MKSLRGIVQSFLGPKRDALPASLPQAGDQEAARLRIARSFLRTEPATVRFEQASATESPVAR